MNKIVDVSIWNNTFESDLLYLKLVLEYKWIDEFVICQSEYDYHGRFKGDTLNPILKDEQFASYLNKIKVITINKNLSSCPEDAVNIDPTAYGNAEHQLRDSPTEYLVNKYDDETRIIISDIDEMVDFTDPDRNSRFMSEINTDDMIQFDRTRFWMDIDMLSFRPTGDMITPSFKIKHIKNGQAACRDKKWKGRLVENGHSPIIFEYCCIFPSREDVISKHLSSLHTFWDENLLNRAMDTGIWPSTKYQPEFDINNRYRWFKRVNLHKNNSPKFIRDNFDYWKTNIVPENYEENRLKYFGVNPQFSDNKDFVNVN